MFQRCVSHSDLLQFYCGVTWFSVCSLPGREEKHAEQCPYGLTKDFCRCCDVCAKGLGDTCYEGFPARGQPMGCAENLVCAGTIPGTYNYRCVRNVTAETLFENFHDNAGRALDDVTQDSGNEEADNASSRADVSDDINSNEASAHPGSVRDAHGDSAENGDVIKSKYHREHSDMDNVSHDVEESTTTADGGQHDVRDSIKRSIRRRLHHRRMAYS
ncbi:PREDICTED: uncharacterized protein LOC106815945 isoform X2 [Priapulus caudatus]|uniref:Uncharacterized protein LOC106815945 isoform X2 n=1 Tax=Priapulus caudatus TaxID=37621 RepID=A0ABM1EUU8_PRICU|nr:PREDICTED: uncharacterized protein LOC106815945 isoform X2 [Priapulus caudatus]